MVSMYGENQSSGCTSGKCGVSVVCIGVWVARIIILDTSARLSVRSGSKDPSSWPVTILFEARWLRALRRF